MNLLYLIRRQYSRFFIREALIIFQVILLLGLMTPIIGDISNLLSIDKLSSQMTSPAVFMQASEYYMIPNMSKTYEIERTIQEIDNYIGTHNVGRTATGYGSLNGIGTSVYFYSDGLINHIQLPIKEIGIFPQEDDALPVIVNDLLAQKYPLGSLIVVENGLLFPVSGEKLFFRFIVTGIMESGGYYYNLRGGATNIQLESIGGNNSSDPYYIIALKGFNSIPILDYSPSSLLFVDSADNQTLEKLSADLGDYGAFDTISRMKERSYEYLVSQNILLFTSAILMLILCICAICSYAVLSVDMFNRTMSIYFICGMSWIRGVMIILLSLALLLLSCIPLSILILPLIWEYIEIRALLQSMLIIAVLYLLGILVATVRLRTFSPILLLRHGD